MYSLGIDLGGTNIAAGVVDEGFNIIGTGKVKTGADRPATAIADDMAQAARLAIKDAGLNTSDISALGIGSPGSIVPTTGVVAYANNLNFKNVPLCAMLKERLGIDAYFENDYLLTYYMGQYSKLPQDLIHFHVQEKVMPGDQLLLVSDGAVGRMLPETVYENLMSSDEEKALSILK